MKHFRKFNRIPVPINIGPNTGGDEAPSSGDCRHSSTGGGRRGSTRRP